MQNLTKGQLIFIGAIVLSAALAGVAAVNIADRFKQPKYVAVYLSTGDIYFGTMRWFPSPRLFNVWLIQRTQDQRLTLDRFKNAVWQPSEPIHISRDKIVFWTYIEPTSPIVAAIEGKAFLPPSQVEVTPSPLPTPQPSPQR
jgi:hypothetical protein